MIGDLFVSVVVWLVSTLIGIFPTSTGFPPEAFDAVSYIGGFVGMFDALIPMGTLLACLTIVFTVEISVFGFRTLKWVISHLPFIGGRG